MVLKSIVCGMLCALTTASLADQRNTPADIPDDGVESTRAVVEPLSLEEGDRIVFLGNAFFERARYYGQLETALTLSWPTANVTFRNIGWSGDTVGGLARTSGRRGAKFGTAEEGFRTLVDHVASLNPTHLFIAYGFNESFGGQAGLVSFESELDRLLTTLDEMGIEIILLSPLPVEDGFGASAAYVDERNDAIDAYANVIQEQARGRNYRFIDLFSALGEETKSFSEDGIHPTAEGYARIADVLLRALDRPSSSTQIGADDLERLREEIVKKNALYFHRWRPRNDAFVYGERKDEQPIAQSEPEKIEPFIKQQEAIIWDLLHEIAAKRSTER